MDMTSWTHGTLYWFGILYGQDDTHNWFLRIANNVKKKEKGYFIRSDGNNLYHK